MKRRRVLAFAALMILLLVAPPAMAASSPSLTGSVSGTELPRNYLAPFAFRLRLVCRR